jgi:voltage-dependent potassium channel beta subunit
MTHAKVHKGKIMEYRQLGKSGLSVSALSLGAWVTFATQIKLSEIKAILTTGYDAGINFFDNAESYAHGEAEILMGQALSQLGFSRDSFCISSKVFFGSAAAPKPTQHGLSRKHILEACNQALARLQVEYLDMYFCHRSDPKTPISEVCWAMHSLVHAGKVMYWGTSEWSAKEILAAQEFCKQQHLIGPSMEQPQYNLFVRERVEREYVPLFEAGLGSTTWSPLASGLLSGKYRNERDLQAGGRFALTGMDWLKDAVLGRSAEQKFQLIERLREIANQAGCSLPQLALAWCLRNPNVSSVILGATNADQLQQNLGALTARKNLTANTFQALESALVGL